MSPKPSLLFRTVAFVAGLAPATEKMPPEQARKLMNDNLKPGLINSKRPPLDRVNDERIADVPVRRYRPKDAQPGTLVYFHGGGWMLGDLDSHDIVCGLFAEATRREVIAVHYRRSPEHRYPAALDDALAVTKTLVSIAGPVVVAGDSAGGNLAASVAQQLKGLIKAQVLIYPVTDCLDERPTYTTYAKGYLLTREAMRYFRREYVPDEARRAEPGCSPIRATDFSGLPPALCVLSECDVLHDEGMEYAQKMKAANVPVDVQVLPGSIHGFFSLQGLTPCREAFERTATWLRSKW